MNLRTNHILSVVNQLDKHEIDYVLGGSGLLYALDLVTHVNDWDITTNAPKGKVFMALQPYTISETLSGDYPFASAYRISINNRESKIEIIGDFAIYYEKNKCTIPSIPTSKWNGIQLGSPEVWYVAYKLMKDYKKANLLLIFLQKKGVHTDNIQRLLQQPLPEEIKHSLYTLKAFHNYKK